MIQRVSDVFVALAGANSSIGVREASSTSATPPPPFAVQGAWWMHVGVYDAERRNIV